MASPRCPSCTDTGTRKCLGCKSVKYCSEECQQADWPFHKNFCKLRKALPPRPSLYHRLIVFFPAHGALPQMHWLDGREMDLDRFLGRCAVSSNDFGHNKLTGARCKKLVKVKYDDNFLANYSQPNEAIVKATAGKLAFPWSGAVVAYAPFAGFAPFEDEDPFGLDMDLVSCSDLAAFFVDYHNDTEAHQRRKARKGPKVEAVMVTCPGEQALNGRPVFAPVKVPTMHPIFEDGKADVSPVSEGIGIPLLTWQSPPNPSWPAKVDQCSQNRHVCYMHKGLNPAAPFSIKHGGFGWSPLKWDTDIGNALVLRQDRKPLTPEFVDAFADFCYHHLVPYFQLRTERDGQVSEARMEEIEALAVAEAKPGKWEVYFGDWRKVKAGVVDDAVVNGRVDGKVRMGLGERDGKDLCYHLLVTHRE